MSETIRCELCDCPTMTIEDNGSTTTYDHDAPFCRSATLARLDILKQTAETVAGLEQQLRDLREEVGELKAILDGYAAAGPDPGEVH